MPEDNVVDPLQSQPKLNSGEEILLEPDPNQVPARAVLERKPGQEPKVTPVKATRRKRVTAKARPCCPRGHSVSSGMKFCPECGSECVQAGPLRCRNMHEVSEGAKFCPACGAEMDLVLVHTPDGGVAQASSVLTPEEQVRKAQEHKLALEMGQQSPVMAYAPGHAPPGAQVTLIHFLIDGCSAFGNVWYRGQEIELWPGHPRWREAQPWITLDAAGQYARWGRQVFGYGPWPGARSYTAGAGRFERLKQIGGDGVVSGPSEEELAAADRKEQQRGRRVPAPIG